MLKATKTLIVALSCGSVMSVSAAPPSSLNINYQKYQNKQKYSVSNFRSDVKDVLRSGNIGDGNQTIRVFPANSSYKRLLIRFKEGEFGGDQLTGVASNLAPNNKYTMKYSFRFMSDWDFGLGGKVPGIGGGSVPAGGSPNDTGMSARIMWRRDSRWDGAYGGSTANYLELYHYHLGQYRDYIGGNDRARHGERTFLRRASKNTWYHVGVQVKVDTGEGIGHIKAQINGVTYYNKAHRYLTGRQNWKMNRFMHVFFYGGGSSMWAPSQNTSLMFDNVRITRDDL